MFINNSTTDPKCNNEHCQNQLSSTNASNNNNNNNNNNFHNNIHPGTINIPFDQTMNLPIMTSSSIVLTPTSPTNASTSFYHITSSFQNPYLSKQTNDIYQLQHHQHQQQQLSPTLDVLSTISNSLNIDKCIDNEYCDYITTFIDTPNSIFSDETPTISTTTTSSSSSSSSSSTLLPNENQSYNSANNIKEDIFKFEPEYIERFQQNFQYQHNQDHHHHPQQNQQQLLSIQDNQSTTTATTEFDEINILNLDAEYFNYDEVNCQSKHQSPCTSPHIDPWLCLNLNNSIVLNDTYKNTKNHENCSVSPKQNNNSNNYNNNNITPLPSITTTFTQQFQNDTYSYDMNFLDDYNNAEAQTQQFTQSSSAFHQLPSILTPLLLGPPVSIPTSPEQNELACDDNNVNIVIDQNKFVQLNNENYNMIVVEKPNREHKNIWSTNNTVVTNTNNNQLLLISNENHNYDDNNIKDNNDCNDDDDGGGGGGGGADENRNENHNENGDDNNNHNDDDDDDEDNNGDGINDNVNEYQSKKLINSKSIIDNSTKSNEKQYSLQCQWIDCYQHFANQSSLVTHIEKKHVEMRKGEEFSCFWLGCVRRNKPFNARYKLLIHMRVHSGEKPNKCPFNGCNKAFSRLENLKIHQRSHTGERPYTCQYVGCLKAFSNSSDRAKHQRTHYDTKPYACQIEGCIKRYTDPSSLRKHVKNHNARDHHQQNTIQTTLQSTTSRRKSHKDTINNSLQINGNTSLLTTTTTTTTTKQRRRYSDSSTITTTGISSTTAPSSSTPATTDYINNIYYDNQSTILTPNSIQNDQFLFDDVFTNDIDNSNNNNNDQNQKCSNTNNNLNTMNFNEMTNCIVTIQNNHNNNHNDCNNALNNHHNNEQLFKSYNSLINANDINHHETNNNNNENIHQTSVDNHHQLTDDVVDEFVSFECVKKFLGEQNMDYIDSAIQNQLDIDYFNEII